MNKIRLDIVGLSFSQTQSGAYALVLGETSGNRRLPIIIGSFEAQAIAVQIEKMTPTRPLTHDLFKSLFDDFNIQLHEVIIYNLIDGIFFAHLVCSQADKTVNIDARTSDAVALAVRFGCPIYTYESIMGAAGIVIESNDFAFLENLDTDLQEASEKPQSQTQEAPNPFTNMSEKKLEESLSKAIESEQYELAAKIRDEIERRNK